LAKVFADNVALVYNGSNPYVTFLGTTVYDPGGNNNNHLDPGETVDLTATLKNIGGVDFTNLLSTLYCSDPYITIDDNSGNFGNFPIDITKENTSDPYTITAASSTPQGHTADFRVIVHEGTFYDTFDFDLTIGTYHYLVWNPDPTPAPGQTMHSILSALGYSGVYTTTLPARAELDMYEAVLVCVGIYSSNYVISASSAEATALVDYLNNGGRMYLEGGDVWYYDPLYQGGYEFGPLFGINATEDGSSDMGPIQGQAGTFTTGMDFTYSGENAWMDHISPTGTGFLIFRDVDNAYDCGVANDAGTHRTVGTSFELGGLADGSGVSTRAALLDSILHFFGIFVVGVDEHDDDLTAAASLYCAPNPFVRSTMISYSYQIPGNTEAQLRIFDAAGRLVKEYGILDMTMNSIVWHGDDQHGRQVPNGIYFVHMKADQVDIVEKVILLK